MENARFTFFEEIRDFYDNEIEKLNEISSNISDSESMQKISSAIELLTDKETKVDTEDKPLLDPITIKKVEEKKKIEQNKNEVHMAYQVGDYSLDSEEYKDILLSEKKSSHQSLPDINEETKETGVIKDDSETSIKPTPLKTKVASSLDSSFKLTCSPGDMETPLIGGNRNVNDEFSEIRDLKENYLIKSLSKERSKSIYIN